MSSLGYLTNTFNKESETGFGFNMTESTQDAPKVTPKKSIINLALPNLQKVSVDTASGSKINATQKGASGLAQQAGGGLKANLNSVNASMGAMKDGIKKLQIGVAEHAKSINMDISSISKKDEMPSTVPELLVAACGVQFAGLVGSKIAATALKGYARTSDTAFVISDLTSKSGSSKSAKKIAAELEASIRMANKPQDTRLDGGGGLLQDARQTESPAKKPDAALGAVVEAGHGVKDIMALDADDPYLAEYTEAKDQKHAIEKSIDHIGGTQKEIADKGLEKGGQDEADILSNSSVTEVKERFNQLNAFEVESQSGDSLACLSGVKIAALEDVSVLDDKEVKDSLFTLNNEFKERKMLDFSKPPIAMSGTAA